MEYEKYIIDNIMSMSGKYTPYQIFTDWITLSAISIQNACKLIHDKTYEHREELYCNVAKKYSADELRILSNMTGALSLLLGDKMCDVLGEIYMKAGCGNKNTGQFFTPYNLSYLTASLIYGNQFDQSEDEQIEINEPSTGGGGMMIAIAQVAKEHGIDYQRKLHVIAQDLDWNGVYMTYIQLSLLGVRAIVVQGDTLIDPYRKGYDECRVFRTPAEEGVLI